jgi:hypothetical protein
MRGDIPPLRNTSSWRDELLSKGAPLTLPLRSAVAQLV